MIGVSLSHGQDPWTSKQKTVHLSLHKVALHLHVGPQQQQAPYVPYQALLLRLYLMSPVLVL
jgi:hypothetical protein